MSADASLQSPRALTFSSEMTACYSGQTNHTLSAIRDGVTVGELEYTVFRGEPGISMISVPEDVRRQGIGTALIHQLQLQFPDEEIKWGGLTEDGAALRKSLPKRVIETEAAPFIVEMAHVRAQLAEIERIAHEGTKLSEEQYEAWNKLHSREFELEGEIGSDRGFKELIITPGLDPVDATLQSAQQAREMVLSLSRPSAGVSP